VRHRKGRGDGNSLMQVAAAVVGTAAASQHIPTQPQPKCSPELVREVVRTFVRVSDHDGATADQILAAMPGKTDLGHVLDALEHLELTGRLVREGVRFLRAPGSMIRARELGDAAQEIERLRARVAELEQAAPAAALDVHAALNTYEVAAGVDPGVEDLTPSMLLVVGANHRRLVVRWQDEGVWVGGCLIAAREDAEALAAFITRVAGG
jgi:hypothetical protein